MSAERANVRVAGDGVYVCGLTQLEPHGALLDYLKARGVKTVFCLALMRDGKLEAAARVEGIAYVHQPLRQGTSPGALRAVAGHARRAAKLGPVLIVGETLNSGGAARIARALGEP